MTWDPDSGAPIFLQKFDHLLAVMAARYDGNPSVAFVDIGSFGPWDEGHTFMPPAQCAILLLRNNYIVQ